MIQRLLLAAIVLGIVACARLPVSPVSIPSRAENIESFRLAGRIGVRNGDENMSARILWEHAPQSDEIILNTPFGSGLARIVSDMNGAVLETADKQRLEESSSESLSERVFGFRLPIKALSRWIVARPEEGDSVVLDSLGRPVQFVSQGWRVVYERYESDQRGALPLLVKLEHEDVSVRLRIESWSLP